VLASRRAGTLIIYRVTNELPVEYHPILFKAGRYRIWLQANGGDAPPVRPSFDAWCDPATGEICAEEVSSQYDDPLTRRSKQPRPFQPRLSLPEQARTSCLANDAEGRGEHLLHRRRRA